MTFKAGQRVRMLVACEGEGDDEQEHTYPPGMAGLVDQIDDRGVHHVVVGTGDQAITVCFDAGDEAEAAMQALPEGYVAARAVAYSSVVGAGIMLLAGDGRCVGMLAVMQVEGGRAEQEAVRDRLVEALNYVAGERWIHHPGRGSDYAVLAGEALMQVSNPQEGLFGIEKGRIVEDGDRVTVYRNHAGTFVRFPDEIVSPRFKELGPSS